MDVRESGGTSERIAAAALPECAHWNTSNNELKRNNVLNMFHKVCVCACEGSRWLKSQKSAVVLSFVV